MIPVAPLPDHRPASRVVAGRFAGMLGRIARITIFLMLFHVVPAIAADACKPVELDICKWAKDREASFLRSIPPPEAQYAQNGMAFVGIEADLGLVKLEIALKATPDEATGTGKSAAAARAALAAEMHQRARRMACGPASRDFIANGGRLRNIYRFANGDLLTIASIADCSLGAVTWSEADLPACAPMGIDLCAEAQSYADVMTSAVMPPEKRFVPEKREIALIAARAEGATLVLESQHFHTRAEFESYYPTPAERDTMAAKLNEAVFKLDCEKPMLSFLLHGGTVRHLYRFRDGEVMADVRVAQCLSQHN